MFINIHTHHLQAYDKNTIVVLNQTQHDNFIETVSSTNQFFSFRTFGLHPWMANANNFESDLEKLETLLKENKIIAIGECGLDKLRGTDLDFQTKIFEMQLVLAQKYNKPLIIHCVRAFNELIAVVKIHKPTVPLIIHGFNNNKNVLKSLLDAGFYISLGTGILNEYYEKSWRERIKMILLEKLFLETDDTFGNIKDVYERAARLLEISVEELENQIELNFSGIVTIY